MTDPWWRPDRFAEKRSFIEQRADILRRIRAFFDARDYVEVETPALQSSPGMEPHVHAFQTDLISVDQRDTTHLYLHTSPEFAMKKLLVAGLKKIYQICHCYRNAEGSPLHSPEFTMLEWYHTGIDYFKLMGDCISFLRHVSNGNTLKFKEKTSDPAADWQKITVRESLIKYAGIDIDPLLDDSQGFATAARDIGIHIAKDDRWDDIFFKVFLDKVEPHLGHPAPTILYDYPASMAALARKKPDDPRYAERFEIYVCAVELANAFGELTDAGEQRARFMAEMNLKENLYGHRWPVDEAFIAALEYGLPDCSGIALGVDRLVMLLTGAEHIDQVLAVSVL